MEKSLLVLFLLLLLAGFAFTAACGGGDGSTDSAQAPEDDDDDTSPDDDDDADDDTDDDTGDDDDSSWDIQADIVQVAGGATGLTGFSMASGEDGEIVIAAVRGRELMVFRYTEDKAVAEERVAPFASDPSLAIDGGGGLHLSFKNLKENALAYATDQSGSWVVEDLESLGGGEATVSIANSIGVDGGGKVHISFFSTVGDTLKYLSNASGQWVSETIEEQEHCGEDNRLGVDAAGTVHVVYKCEGVQYATNESGSWVHEEISSDFGVVGFSSLDLDGDGNPHVVYSETYNDRLYYATNAGGVWESEAILDGSDYNKETSPPDIAVDAGGFAHVAIWDEGQPLFYATNKSGSWTAEMVPETVVGVRPEIDVDGEGNAHIAYHDYDPAGEEDLNYVTNAAKAWTRKSIDAPGYAGTHCSLALDSNGHAHIIYMNESLAEITYATNRDGSWSSETVEPTGVELPNPASLPLALDADGRPHSAFVNDLDQLIRAKRDAKGWTYEVAVINVYGGGFPGLALDAGGKAHIAYYQGGNQDLVYLTDASGDWVEETVVSDQDVGLYPRIGVDETGGVHILCFDGWDERILYATNSSGTWVDETFLPAGEGEPSFSLFLTSGGANDVHLSFWGNGYLHYLTGGVGDWDNSYVTEDVETAYQSLAVDSDGYPHLVYFKGGFTYKAGAEAEDLMYATHADGWWENRRADWGGSVGLYASLVLDGEGTAHAAYFGEGALVYATFEHGYPGW